MAGSRSTAPLNRGKSVLIAARLSASEIQSAQKGELKSRKLKVERKKDILHRGRGGAEGTEKKKQIPRFARNDTCSRMAQVRSDVRWNDTCWRKCERWRKGEAMSGGF